MAPRKCAFTGFDARYCQQPCFGGGWGRQSSSKGSGLRPLARSSHEGGANPASNRTWRALTTPSKWNPRPEPCSSRIMTAATSGWRLAHHVEGVAPTRPTGRVTDALCAHEAQSSQRQRQTRDVPCDVGDLCLQTMWTNNCATNSRVGMRNHEWRREEVPSTRNSPSWKRRRGESTTLFASLGLMVCGPTEFCVTRSWPRDVPAQNPRVPTGSPRSRRPVWSWGDWACLSTQWRRGPPPGLQLAEPQCPWAPLDRDSTPVSSPGVSGSARGAKVGPSTTCECSPRGPGDIRCKCRPGRPRGVHGGTTVSCGRQCSVLTDCEEGRHERIGMFSNLTLDDFVDHTRIVLPNVRGCSAVKLRHEREN